MLRHSGLYADEQVTRDDHGNLISVAILSRTGAIVMFFPSRDRCEAAWKIDPRNPSRMR